MKFRIFVKFLYWPLLKVKGLTLHCTYLTLLNTNDKIEPQHIHDVWNID